MADSSSADGAEPTPWPRRAARFLLAVLTGCLFWASVPDTDLWWLGFVMWVPWMWLVADLRPAPAFFYGLVTGVSAIAVGYFWMTELLTRFAGFPMWLAVLTHFLFSFWQGSGWGLAALLLVWVRRRSGISVLWLMPLCWVAVEALLPNLFPTYMALAWCWHPAWIQLAEVGGVSAVTFAMCSINAALFVLLRAWVRERRIDPRAAIVGAAWLIGVPAYGLIRISMVDAEIERAPKLRFGVVQGNFGIETFRDAPRRILDGLQRETARLEREGAEIALWGETAYPARGFYRDSTQDHLRGPRRVRRGFGIPLVFGLVTYERDRATNRYPWNTAWVLERDGSLGDRYDKVYPLLFGEAAPSFVDPDWYRSTIPNASHVNTGDEPGLLRVEDWRLGPLICYEDLLPRYVRATALLDVHVFVNLTNDSWFGRTREQHEHLGLAVFRAVEHRKSLLRADTAGVSAHVDPAGRVRQRTLVTDSDRDGLQAPVGFVAEVPMMDPQARTVYGRTGELFNAMTILMLGGLAARRRREHEPAAAASR